MPIKLALCVGTRPEILMATPLIKEMKGRVPFVLIHSGQHYDFLMSKVFFQLSMTRPDIFLNCKRGGEFEATSDMLGKYFDVFKKIKPTATIVFGDTNNVLVAAYASIRAGVPVIHIESGLRMNDFERPEEVIRVLVDRISQMLLCDGSEDVENLLKEGIEGKRIFQVGSVKFDIVKQYEKRINKKIFEKHKIKKTGQKIILVTLHRQENVDNEKKLKVILGALKELGNENMILFPVHPRTKKRIAEFGLKKSIEKIKNLHILKPLNYVDFISFLSQTDLVITDSGGVPRETLFFGIPTIMFHKNFFMEQIWRKPLFISGYDKKTVIRLANKLLKMPKKKYKNPYGDYKSTKRIVDTILKNKRLLRVPSSTRLVL